MSLGCLGSNLIYTFKGILNKNSWVTPFIWITCATLWTIYLTK